MYVLHWYLYILLFDADSENSLIITDMQYNISLNITEP